MRGRVDPDLSCSGLQIDAGIDQLCGAAHPCGQQVVPRRDSELLAEEPGEVPRTEVYPGRERDHVDRLAEVFFEVVSRLPKPRRVHALHLMLDAECFDCEDRNIVVNGKLSREPVMCELVQQHPAGRVDAIIHPTMGQIEQSAVTPVGRRQRVDEGRLQADHDLSIAGLGLVVPDPELLLRVECYETVRRHATARGGRPKVPATPSGQDEFGAVGQFLIRVAMPAPRMVLESADVTRRRMSQRCDQTDLRRFHLSSLAFGDY